MSIQPNSEAAEANAAGFICIRRHPVPALNLTLEEYRHEITGARHIHLASDVAENAFMVAFKTLPQDSTGVAHVLEHTVLCGSERYPVRDPFFLMIRRSLNTFMNAFTGSDYTAYPFATVNRKDYFYLMSVYLDAVFFANLSPLDLPKKAIALSLSSRRMQPPRSSIAALSITR